MTSDTFFTSGGVSVPAVTTQKMREIDRVAAEGTGPNLFQMMENAGRNLAELCVASLGSKWFEAHIVVLAGTGGNGGGGMSAARHLANHGGSVTLVPSNREGLHPVPCEQFELYGLTGAPVATPHEMHRLKPDVIIDAVLGYSAVGVHVTATTTMTLTLPKTGLDVEAAA